MSKWEIFRLYGNTCSKASIVKSLSNFRETLSVMGCVWVFHASLRKGFRRHEKTNKQRKKITDPQKCTMSSSAALKYAESWWKEKLLPEESPTEGKSHISPEWWYKSETLRMFCRIVVIDNGRWALFVIRADWLTTFKRFVQRISRTNLCWCVGMYYGLQWYRYLNLFQDNSCYHCYTALHNSA